MANLDEFYRVEKHMQEAAAGEDGDIDMLDENDDVTGTHHEVEAMVDGGESVYEDPSGDELNVCVIGDELPVFLTTTRSNLSAASSTTMYHSLLTPVAETAASTFGTLPQAPTFTLEELNQYVELSTTDESNPSEHYQQERPTEVVELLSKALDPAAAIWVASDRQPHQGVNHYATITEVSHAFTFNQRQHAAFTIIAAALLRTFLRQEQSGIELATATTAGMTLNRSSETSNCSCFAVVLVERTKAASLTQSARSA